MASFSNTCLLPALHFLKKHGIYYENMTGQKCLKFL